jgi:hypothetical protein
MSAAQCKNDCALSRGHVGICDNGNAGRFGTYAGQDGLAFRQQQCRTALCMLRAQGVISDEEMRGIQIAVRALRELPHDPPPSDLVPALDEMIDGTRAAQ